MCVTTLKMNMQIFCFGIFLICFGAIRAEECRKTDTDQYYQCLKKVHTDQLVNQQGAKQMRSCLLSVKCKPASRAPFPNEDALKQKRLLAEKCVNKSRDDLAACLTKKGKSFPIDVSLNEPYVDKELDKLPSCTEEQARKATVCFFTNSKPQNASELIQTACQSLKECYSKMTPACQELFEKTKNQSCLCYKEKKLGTALRQCISGPKAKSAAVAAPTGSETDDDSLFCQKEDVCESFAKGKSTPDKRGKRQTHFEIEQEVDADLEDLVSAFKI